MASPTEVVRKYFQKVDELKEINALVEKKRGELLELQAEEDAILKRHEAQAQKIREDQLELNRKQAEFEASVDKSHLAFFYSVEELNEQALARKQELSDLSERITKGTETLAELESKQKQTEGRVAEKLRELEGLDKKLSTAQNKLDGTLKKIDQAKAEYETVKQETNALFSEAGEFEKKRKHLDLMERRIRNYYKKAGLTFRP